MSDLSYGRRFLVGFAIVLTVLVIAVLATPGGGAAPERLGSVTVSAALGSLAAFGIDRATHKRLALPLFVLLCFVGVLFFSVLNAAGSSGSS